MSNSKDIGRINYVPITAVQRFDMEKKFIRNGVTLTAVLILKVSGAVGFVGGLIAKDFSERNWTQLAVAEVYLGPISFEFEGSLRWIEERRRLEFDFEESWGFHPPILPGWCQVVYF